ncbi:hypothetical protein BLOT_005870 [Blomia tropicalis]|nr:hypothetical protein BLOT_005870 [Blomia tropicalis]
MFFDDESINDNDLDVDNEVDWEVEDDDDDEEIGTERSLKGVAVTLLTFNTSTRCCFDFLFSD